MDENNLDESEVLETPEPEEELELDLEEELEGPEEETPEQLKKRIEELESKNRKLYERAKKVEEKPAAKPAPAPSKQNDISTRDMYALMQAQVPLEDMDQVVSYAKFTKQDVAEALKSNVVKTMLSDAAEMRKTAEVANTAPSRRPSSQRNPENLYEKARAGELPESDTDFAKLAEARISSERFKERR